MKKFYFALLLLCSTFTLSAQDATVNITFFVNVDGLTINEGGMLLSGSFNEWQDMAMMENTDGNWFGTVALTPGTEVEYKFKNGPDGWEDGIEGDCVNGFGNRVTTVPAESQSLNLLGFNSCSATAVVAAPAASNVTFSVDMNDYTETFTTPFVSGTFNGWAGDANPLTDEDGDGIWTTTIPLDNGFHDFKFQLDAWTVQEQWTEALSCTQAFGDNGEFVNRVITLEGDTEVCFKWNACDACGEATGGSNTSNVTFSVDMTDYTEPFTTPFVSGTFNGWAGDANPLTDEDGDGIWTTTIPLENGFHDFKYQLDAWTVQEEWTEALSCTQAFGDNGEFVNRVITLEGDTEICFKWNTCDACATGAPVDTFSVTFTVDMSLEDSIDAAGMFIAGTFNDWSDAPMTDNGDGTWSYTGRFGQGDMLAYKFKNGPGGWEANEVRSCTLEGTLGDRGHTVGGGDEVLPTVCFNSCAACFLDVTFVVDPSQEEVAPEGMLIAGVFNGWTDEAMTLDEATGLWSATVSLSPGTSVEYKFKNGPDGWEGDFAGSCSIDGTGNRVLVVPETAGSLSTVCFNSCVGCNQVTLNVTVDMNQETVAPEGVFIAGGFNGWIDEPMTNNGDGTYSASLIVDKNSTVEYKFKNGPDGWEMDFSGDCGTGNRMTAVAEEDVTVAEVCFNACTSCTQPMVTFTVNMSEEEVAAEGVFLAGAFNDFTDMPMTDNGDGTWSSTIQLAPRTSYEYKFKNGPDGWENIPGNCAVGFGSNREVKVNNVDINIPTVCFNSCVGCGLISATFTVDMSQENVVAEGVRVAGTFSEWTDVLLTDVGNGIWTANVGVMPNDTIEYKFKNGPDGWEETLVGECASAETGNRVLIVADADVAVAQTCFNSCEICMEEPDPDPIGLTTLNIENSCMNDDGTITIRFDLQFNCDNAVGDLSGMPEIGFHSGANNWSSVVEWDAEGAATAVNIGEDVFEVTIDPVAYYDGIESLDDLDNILMVFNQGPTVPDEPWASEGKTDGEGGLDANCGDILLIISELRNCSDIGGSETISTAVLLAEGSCITEDGNVNIVFDLADNCLEAAGSLAGLSEVGFHSGANDWSSVVEWNADGATTGVNDGNDVFSVSIDPASYYGVALADLSNIFFVLNQGPAFPDAPWDSEAKAQGDGACVDFNLTISELPTCAAAPPVESTVQDLPLTYESDAVEYQLFAFGEAIATRIDNPDPTGENTSSKVMSIEKVAGAQPWAGVAMPVATTMDFSGSPMMFVTVWSPRADVPFLLKIEDTNSAPDASGNPSIISEVFANTTTSNAWEVLEFDMSTHPGFSLDNTYNQVVIFADMNNPGVGDTFFVDNLGQIIISTSTVDLVQENQFTVAPNPFNSQTLVTWENVDNETFQVSLLNVTGQVMRTYRNVQGESLRIAKDDLVGGMYFLNFRDEKGNMGTMKLLIE